MPCGIHWLPCWCSAVVLESFPAKRGNVPGGALVGGPEPEPEAEAEPAVVVAETVAPAEEPVDAPVDVPDWPAPYIRLMGPIAAFNLPEKIPGRAVEMLSFLALQDGPVPGSTVQKRLWPGKHEPSNNDVRQLAKRIRLAIGHDPDGNQLLPEARKDTGFSSHPMIRTDWHDFRELIGPDLKATPNENLVAAIRFVRGAPFEGAEAHRARGWWLWQVEASFRMTKSDLKARPV